MNIGKLKWTRFAFQLCILLVLAALLFNGVLVGKMVLWSNDGPYGILHGHPERLARITGDWDDRNGLGSGGAGNVCLSNALFWVLGDLGYAKFYAPLALVFLGMSAWCCFVQMGLSPLASCLGSLAGMLGSLWFSIACWGVASQCIAAGMTFLALGLLQDMSTSNRAWIRTALAGMTVGYAVADGADVGVIWALFTALYMLYQGATLMNGNPWERLGKQLTRSVIVVIMALFSAWSAVESLFPLLKQGPK